MLYIKIITALMSTCLVENLAIVYRIIIYRLFDITFI
jgi:hypothetical protein